MYKVEYKNGYTVYNTVKNTSVHLNSWERLVEYIARHDTMKATDYSRFWRNSRYPREVTISSSNINVTGNDTMNEYYENLNCGDYKVVKRPFYILDDCGRGIDIGSLLKAISSKKKEIAEYEAKIENWYIKNKDNLPKYAGWNLTTKENWYNKVNGADIKNEELQDYPGFRSLPVYRTGSHYKWKYYRRPKLRNRVLSNINFETGRYISSDYRYERLPCWDDRGRHLDRSWKSSYKCKKQWMKHLKPSEYNYNKRELTDF